MAPSSARRRSRKDPPRIASTADAYAYTGLSGLAGGGGTGAAGAGGTPPRMSPAAPAATADAEGASTGGATAGGAATGVGGVSLKGSTSFTVLVVVPSGLVVVLVVAMVPFDSVSVVMLSVPAGSPSAATTATCCHSRIPRPSQHGFEHGTAQHSHP